MQCAGLGTLVPWPRLGRDSAAAREPAGRGTWRGQRLCVQVRRNRGGPVEADGTGITADERCLLVLWAPGPPLLPPCSCSVLLGSDTLSLPRRPGGRLWDGCRF